MLSRLQCCLYEICVMFVENGRKRERNKQREGAREGGGLKSLKDTATSKLLHGQGRGKFVRNLHTMAKQYCNRLKLAACI